MGPWVTATFNGLQTIERGSFPLNVSTQTLYDAYITRSR